MRVALSIAYIRGRIQNNDGMTNGRGYTQRVLLHSHFVQMKPHMECNYM